MHCTTCREHVWLAAHPPLSRSHDGSQYVSLVVSNTLHFEPVRHSWYSQGSRSATTQPTLPLLSNCKQS